jgi:microcystin degradation protein MlrC
MRIGVGGLHVECCTYNPVEISDRDFTIWRGAEILGQPYFDVLGAIDAEWIPGFYARAVPGGPIAAATYAGFRAEFLAGLRAAGQLDGLYLAMHGAVAVTGMEDAEADWIGAARAVVGPDCLIAVSYDLHGSLSQNIVDAIDIFASYRTAPHIDVAATQARALAMLHRALLGEGPPLLAWAPVPVLLAGEQTSTESAPARELYAGLPAIDAIPGVWDASLQVGYLWADEPRSAACAVLTGTDAGVLAREAAALAAAWWAARHDFGFGVPVGSIAEGVALARASATHPVILADSGDNPTAGGVGDRAAVLAEAIARGLTRTIVAGIADPEATAAAFAAGCGARLTRRIGGGLDPASPSVPVTAEVVRLHDPGPALERQAVLRVDGVEVVVAARRRPYHRMADFLALGLDPAAADTLIVKSGYLAPELAPLANPVFMMLSEGAVNQDHTTLVRRRKPGKLFPFDGDFGWAPQPIFSARSRARLAAG